MSSAAAAIATGSVAADTAAGSSIAGPDSTATMTNVVTKEEEMNEITATPTTPFSEEKDSNTTDIAITAASLDTKDSLRVVRLEQNRKAASESRKRKRILLDELQRSVIFFTRANDTLKQQNQNLQTLLQQAQNQIKNIDEKSAEVTTGTDESKATKATTTNPSEQSSHDDDSKKTMHLPILIPPAQVPLKISNFLNTVETGATIQAMTNFQQAASAAMKAALLHMQQQYNNNSGEADHSISGIQQQHQSLFEIATLTVPTTTTKATTTVAGKSSTATDASTNENKSEI